MATSALIIQLQVGTTTPDEDASFEEFMCRAGTDPDYITLTSLESDREICVPVEDLHALDKWAGSLPRS